MKILNFFLLLFFSASAMALAQGNQQYSAQCQFISDGYVIAKSSRYVPEEYRNGEMVFCPKDGCDAFNSNPPLVSAQDLLDSVLGKGKGKVITITPFKDNSSVIYYRIVR